MTPKEASELDEAEITGQVEEELGLYVYILTDPRTDVPFYVGRGRGLRWRAHEWGAQDVSDEAASGKDQKIRELESKGLKPRTWILRYGLNESEAKAVEASAIDLLGTFPVDPQKEGEAPPRPLGLLVGGPNRQLLNQRREASRGHGIRLLSDVYDEYAAPVLTTSTPLVLVKLGPWQDAPHEFPDGQKRSGHGYKHEWLTALGRDAGLDEMALSARGDFGWAEWRFSEDTPNRVEYVVAVHRGVTRGLFRITPGSWASTDYPRRNTLHLTPVREGRLWEETVGPHGHVVPGLKRGSTLPIYYWPR